VETVTLDTNLKSPTPITLTTHGNVIGDISLLPHARLRQKPDLLFLGNVTRGKPQEVELQLRLVGEYRKNTRFTVKKVVPEELQVSFGEPTAGYGDLSMHVPMKVVLPAHAKPQAWLGTKPEQMGQILLETTNPDVKEFKILVQAAVVEPVSPAATN
jgi:hypothetical protein